MMKYIILLTCSRYEFMLFKIDQANDTVLLFFFILIRSGENQIGRDVLLYHRITVVDVEGGPCRRIKLILMFTNYYSII